MALLARKSVLLLLFSSSSSCVRLSHTHAEVLPRSLARGRPGVSVMSAGGGARKGPIVAALESPTISLGAAGALLSALVVNRFVLDEVANSQSRSDLLATAAAASVVLQALGSLEIDARLAEPQELLGTRIECELNTAGYQSSAALDALLRWLGDSLLQCTPSSSVLVFDRTRGRTLLRMGVMGSATQVESGPILDKCLTADRERGTYLASLQNYPGKLEFSYLPSNTQCVLVHPFADGSGALVLGANKARAYTSKHLAWARMLTGRLGAELAESGRV